MSDSTDIEDTWHKFVKATFGNFDRCVEVFKEFDGQLVDSAGSRLVDDAFNRLCPNEIVGEGRSFRFQTALKLQRVYDVTLSRLFAELGLDESRVGEREQVLNTVKRIRRYIPNIDRQDRLLLEEYVSKLLPMCYLCQNWISPEIRFANFGCRCETVLCEGCYTRGQADVDHSSCPTCRTPKPAVFVPLMMPQVPSTVPVDIPDSPVREPELLRQRIGDNNDDALATANQTIEEVLNDGLMEIATRDSEITQLRREIALRDAALASQAQVIMQNEASSSRPDVHPVTDPILPPTERPMVELARMQKQTTVRRAQLNRIILQRQNEALNALDRRLQVAADPSILSDSMLRDLDDPLRGMLLTPCEWTDDMDDMLAALTMRQDP